MSPYVASSKAMAIPKGIGGIENNPNLNNGATKPTTLAHFQLTKNAHNSTGKCIGQSIAPICGTCPVTKGSSIASARHTPEIVTFFTVLFFFILLSPFSIGNNPSASPTNHFKNKRYKSFF